MPAFKDLSGMKFGRLTAVSRAGNARSGGTRWHCRCDCGGSSTPLAAALKSGNSTTCGCGVIESTVLRSTAHGELVGGKHSPEYRTWWAAITRCENVNSAKYAIYGGRGIRICSGWRSDFAKFRSDMGKKPSAQHSIDRVNNDAGYDCGRCVDCLSRGAPPNCRWATLAEQSDNRRTNVWVEFRGETKTLTQWADGLGILAKNLRYRIERWGIDRAMTEPVKPKRRAA
jgi:hypothetical protein